VAFLLAYDDDLLLVMMGFLKHHVLNLLRVLSRAVKNLFLMRSSVLSSLKAVHLYVPLDRLLFIMDDCAHIPHVVTIMFVV
jgi:hypothetical protein